jgi:hypothetical protein
MILILGVSACADHFEVFFASFSSWSNLSTPVAGITLSLVPGLVTAAVLCLSFILVK